LGGHSSFSPAGIATSPEEKLRKRVEKKPSEKRTVGLFVLTRFLQEKDKSKEAACASTRKKVLPQREKDGLHTGKHIYRWQRGPASPYVSGEIQYLLFKLLQKKEER